MTERLYKWYDNQLILQGFFDQEWNFLFAKISTMIYMYIYISYIHKYLRYNKTLRYAWRAATS